MASVQRELCSHGTVHGFCGLAANQWAQARSCSETQHNSTQQHTMHVIAYLGNQSEAYWGRLTNPPDKQPSSTAVLLHFRLSLSRT